MCFWVAQNLDSANHRNLYIDDFHLGDQYWGHDIMWKLLSLISYMSFPSSFLKLPIVLVDRAIVLGLAAFLYPAALAKVTLDQDELSGSRHVITKNINANDWALVWDLNVVIPLFIIFLCYFRVLIAVINNSSRVQEAALPLLCLYMLCWLGFLSVESRLWCATIWVLLWLIFDQENWFSLFFSAWRLITLQRLNQELIFMVVTTNNVAKCRMFNLWEYSIFSSNSRDRWDDLKWRE